MSKNKEILNIVDKLYDWDVSTGQIGDFCWRIILTPDGQELQISKIENFDRWANSEYEAYVVRDVTYAEIYDDVAKFFECE